MSVSEMSAIAQPTVRTLSGTRIATAAIDSFITGEMRKLEIPGISFAIVNDGKIVYERYAGVARMGEPQKIDRDAIFEAASLSKPVFAYFTLKMAEKGVIDLDRPLYFYLPDSSMERDVRYRDVNAKMVLQHSTGFPNWRYFEKADSTVKIKPDKTGDFFMKADPGKKFTYSGEGYYYLARVLAVNTFNTMKSLDDLFRKEVAVPLKMTHAWYTWNDYLYEHKVSGHKKNKPTDKVWGAGLPSHHSFIVNSAGSLQTNASAYANFLIALMNRQGLRERSVDLMLTKQIDKNPEPDGINGWTCGIGVSGNGGETLYKHGGNNGDFQSGFAFSMKQKVAYVFFVNCDKGTDFGKALDAFLLK